MKPIKMKTAYSLLLSFALLISPLPLVAMIEAVLSSDQLANCSTTEKGIPLSQKVKRAFSKVINECSVLDKDDESPVHELKLYFDNNEIVELFESEIVDFLGYAHVLVSDLEDNAHSIKLLKKLDSLFFALEQEGYFSKYCSLRSCLSNCDNLKGKKRFKGNVVFNKKTRTHGEALFFQDATFNRNINVRGMASVDSIVAQHLEVQDCVQDLCVQNFSVTDATVENLTLSGSLAFDNFSVDVLSSVDAVIDNLQLNNSIANLSLVDGAVSGTLSVNDAVIANLEVTNCIPTLCVRTLSTVDTIVSGNLNIENLNVDNLEVDSLSVMDEIVTRSVTITPFSTAGIVRNSATGLLSSSLIVNADVSESAAIGDTKLATIITAGKVSNSATTATSANTANAIVARDDFGDFSAGTITANLSGNATTATNATNFTGSLAGDVTGTQGATIVALVGGQAAANVSAATVLANAATNLNTASTVVKRDVSGNFSAGTISANLSGNAATATTTTTAITSSNATNFTGSLLGDVTGSQSATVVSLVGGQTATDVAAGSLLANEATSTNGASKIVRRDANGSFSADTVSLVDEAVSGSVTIAPFSTAGVVHNNASGLLSTSLIVNADITDATIGNAKLATISSVNTAGSIVVRDESGNFAAGTITANLNGNARTATTATTATIATNATSFTGSLSGDVAGTQGATVVSLVGGQAAANVAAATVLANAATNLNTANTIVRRDANGSFSADTVSLVDEVVTGSVTVTPFSTAGVVHNNASGLLSSLLIMNADVDPAAAIMDSKLATISTAGKVANSATTATSTNTPNTIASRDALGNFAAGTITANLSGNATTATTATTAATATNATNFTGSLVGDVTGTQGATVVSFVGGQTAANVAAGSLLANEATSANTASTIVRRDASGNFSASRISLVDEVVTGSVTVTPFSTAGVVHNNASGLLSCSLIVNADVDPAAAIVDTKLATISTAGKVANSATTSTSTNTPNTIVSRDASGNFAAGIITANLSGNATTSTTATNFTGSLTGDVTGTQGATVVSLVGGQTAANVAAATVLANAATNLNAPSTIVRRDANGSFAAGTVSVVDEAVSGSVTIAPFSTAGVVHNNASGLLSSSLVVNNDIANGTVSNDKLATVASINTFGALVVRDGAGSFAATSIALTGTVTNPTDAATKEYVDAVTSTGLIAKDPALVLGDSNTVLSGLQTIDGVALSANDRVLLVSQTDPVENGLWLAQVGSWTRPIDFAPGDTAGSAYILIISGVSYEGSSWFCDTLTAIIDTDPIHFVLFTLPNATTGASVGTGIGQIFRNKTGVTLNFKTLNNSDTHILITNNADTVDVGTDATSSNSPSTLVARDSSGNFSAGTITANLIGNATTSTTSINSTNFTGLLSGDVSGTQSATVVNLVGGQTAANVAAATVLANAATNLNTASAIVRRDANGSFAAGTVSLVDEAVSGSVTIAPFSTAGVVHNNAAGLLSSSLIVNTDITDGTIANAKLATISSANTAGNIVVRDGSGNFAAGTITANLNGNATTATTAVTTTNFTGPLVGDVTGTQGATVVSLVGGQTAANVASATIAANAATNLNTPSTIVRRDANGSFAAGTVSLVDEIASGNVTLSSLSTAGIVHNSASGLLSSSLIVNADVSPTAAIVDTKLATISTAGKVSNSATTATSVNTTNAIVARDSSGNFSAGTITANLNGNATTATTATTATNFTGTLAGDVTGTQGATVVSLVGGQTAANVASATIAANEATNLNTPSTIVRRDTNGSFAAGTVSLVDEAVSGSVTIAPFSTAGVVHNNASGLLSSSLIVNADVAAAAGIVDTKLATISTAGKVANSSTTAVSTNTPSTIVLRDGSGNFSASTITANLNGNATTATTATTATNFTGTLAGDVTGTQSATVVSLVGGQTATNVAASSVLANAATNLNAASTIVRRDANGSLAVGTVSLVDEIASGNVTLSLFSTAGVVHNNASGLLSSSLIVNADVSPTAAIVDTKLATISTAGKVSNSATTGTSLNTTNAIVARDASGNFSAGTITANLNGNAITATNFTGTLAGDVTGTQSATVVSLVGGQTAANVAAATVLANAATNLNTASTIVRRDENGSFAAGTVSLVDEAVSGSVIIAPFSTAGVVHNNASGLLSSSLIVNADVAAAAGIVDTKLATISTAGKVANSATTATSANTTNAIVARDSSGNFSAGTITASLNGNATTSTTSTNATNFTGSLAGDVTGTQGATVVSLVGGQTAANVAAATVLANAATSANSQSAIVSRDGSGNFSTNMITIVGTTTNSTDAATKAYVDSTVGGTSLNTPNTVVRRDGTGSFVAQVISMTDGVLSGNLNVADSTSTVGNINKAGTRFIHNFGTNNTFVGKSAGNFTMTGTGNNTGIGVSALIANTSGIRNTALGSGAGLANTTGSNNVFIGYSIGTSTTTGSNNIYIDGNSLAPANESNAIRIGNTQTDCYIQGIFGSTARLGAGVLITSSGRLGTLLSSQKFKENIQPLSDISAQRIYSLNPVSFMYENDETEAEQFGLIAEEVAQVIPEVVIYQENEPLTLRYDQVGVLVLKEVQNLRNEIDVLREEMDGYLQRMYEQDSIIKALLSAQNISTIAQAS